MYSCSLVKSGWILYYILADQLSVIWIDDKCRCRNRCPVPKFTKKKPFFSEWSRCASVMCARASNSATMKNTNFFFFLLHIMEPANKSSLISDETKNHITQQHKRSTNPSNWTCFTRDVPAHCLLTFQFLPSSYKLRLTHIHIFMNTSFFFLANARSRWAEIFNLLVAAPRTLMMNSATQSAYKYCVHGAPQRSYMLQWRWKLASFNTHQTGNFLSLIGLGSVGIKIYIYIWTINWMI